MRLFYIKYKIKKWFDRRIMNDIVWRIWYCIPDYIEDKTVFNREYFTDPIPSFSFLGIEIKAIRDEGASWGLKWWNKIEFVKN